MKKRFSQLFIIHITCIILLLTGFWNSFYEMNIIHAKEIGNIDERKPYTVQDFLAYMQHGYQDYNIFCENPNKAGTLFVTDEMYYEYRTINTDLINATGEIAVICDPGNTEDAEQIEDELNQDTEDDSESGEDSSSEESGIIDYARIAYTIEQDESSYIKRIYGGSRLPEELTLTYIYADELKISDLEGFDLYIFEESSKYTGISEEVFLHLNNMLKENKDTIVYDFDITKETWGTGEQSGSNVTVIENSDDDEYTLLISGNSDEYLRGMSTKGNGIIYPSTPKYKDYVQKDFVENGYGWKWTSYMLYEQRLSYGVLMFNPYTTIKVLPTYDSETLDRDIFKDPGAKGPYSYLRYTNQIILPSHVTTIPDKTFYNYDVLEDINLNNITIIGNSSFYGCKSLKTVQFSEKNTVTIGESAFEDCGLVDIEIPESIKKIGKNAFINNYVTDPQSLEHNATTNQKYQEYQSYIETHEEDEEKVSSVKSVNIVIGDDGLDLELNVFSVDDTCQVCITYKEENGKSLFEFINQNEDKWEASDISATQLNSLKHIAYLRSETEIDSGETGKEDDDAKNENIYDVTFVDTVSLILSSETIQVRNGKKWMEYLPVYNDWFVLNMDLQYIFRGWINKDGQLIDGNDIIQLQKDITLYTYYTVSGSDAEKTVKLHFYNCDKTIDVKMGNRLCDYDIPSTTRNGDIFLGWSSIYPIQSPNDILSQELIVTPYIFGDETEITLYPVFQSDINDKTLITTKETLSGEPIYRLNKNNIGSITNYDGESDYDYRLDQTSYNESDKQNAEIIKNKILNSNSSKIAILPKGYTVNVDKLKKKGYFVIKTNLELDDYISALTYMNCRYFQYLQLIQTPYFETEDELSNWEKDESLKHYGELCVSDFKADNPSCSKGFIYFVNRNKFAEYYNLCMDMETKLYAIGNNIKLHKGMKITDAIWAVNDLVIKEYAYDKWIQIYDLNWFLQITDEKRNEAKKTNYHGVCASYSKFAFALLGLYGYEAIPCTTALEEGTCHSFNKIVVNGTVYYCDFTWTNSCNSAQYMFMTDNNMIFNSHRNLTPDNMGHTITYDRKSSKLSSMKIKSVKNQKGKKMIVTFNKVKNAGGYEIQYSTNRKFKSAKKKTVSKTKIVISKLKKNKTYYVRVRPYKNVKIYRLSDDKFKSVKYYGTWSKSKKVKIKK